MQQGLRNTVVLIFVAEGIHARVDNNMRCYIEFALWISSCKRCSHRRSTKSRGVHRVKLLVEVTKGTDDQCFKA
jgi:hypothetical protein